MHSLSNIFLFQAIQFNQTVQFSISIAFVYTKLNVKTVLFQVIQFSIDMHFSSTTLGHSGPASNGNEWGLRISGTSPLDCLVSYPENLLGRGSYPSAEMQSVYYTAPDDWTTQGFEAKKCFYEIITFSLEQNNFGKKMCSPVGWDCWVHRLYLCGDLRLPRQGSWILY